MGTVMLAAGMRAGLKRAAGLLVAAALLAGPALAQDKPKKPKPFDPGPQQAWLVENLKKPGWVQTPSGLQYRIVTPGRADRPMPDPYDTVRVHYEGRLLTGQVFDSTYGGQPATFPLHTLIPSWQEALQSMRPGEKRELAIPARIGYGAKGTSDIPGNATLLFTMELLNVVRDR